ncbi:RNA polymerase sigma factor [Breznakia pachnodae]|uniref:RNA polymerase sigma factor n=1 Tax=Breznakia pachnodae TaxID=265178 RepID=A0ABU0E1K3_9FIRM|nr:RNA polymerase sigma factor [Breznakia pachnodae]MDQ0360767.1 RNA polymerase sigma factor (sigma-70 family) [Breznakia pachnodae]
MGKRIDTKVVEQFAKGDKKAFEDIYEFYKNSIYLFSISLLKNQADAEEVVQDTFIKVYQKIHTLKELKTFHAWLFTITYNTAMKLYHKKKYQLTLEDESFLDTLVTVKDDQKKDYNNQEVIDVIKEELGKLPNKFVIVGELRFFDDLTTREIAGILEIPEGTVKNRLNRVRTSIKPSLAKRGFNPEHYLSVTGIPILYQVFSQYANQVALSKVASETILSNVTLANASASVVKKSNKLAATLAVSLAGVALVSGAALATTDNTQPLAINEILYTSEEYTSAGEPVQIVMNQRIDSQAVSIKNSEGDVEYSINGDEIIFQVDENDTYTIDINGLKETLEINNIDNDAPEMADVDYDEDKVIISVHDEHSGIDYENSSYVYNDVSYNFPSDGVIESVSEGSIQIHLSDNVGNQSEFKINLTLGEE